MLMELHKVDFQDFIFETLAIQLLCNITTGSPKGGEKMQIAIKTTILTHMLACESDHFLQAHTELWLVSDN